MIVEYLIAFFQVYVIESPLSNSPNSLPPECWDFIMEECNPPGSAPSHQAGLSRTRDSGTGGGRSTKEAKGYSH